MTFLETVTNILLTIIILHRNPREPFVFGDYKLENLKTDEAKRLWVVANKQIKSNMKKLKLIRIKEKRLQAKVKTIQDLLSHLKEKNKISNDCFRMLDVSLFERMYLLLTSFNISILI